RHVFRNIPYAALITAAQIYSNVEDFDMERICIDLSLLLNEYPPSFISKHFHRFFEINQAMPVFERVDSQVYYQLYQQLLHKPTRREQQLQQATGNIDVLPEVLQRKTPWDSNVMYAKYNFESGPRLTFQRDFRTWWKKHFAYKGSNVEHVQLKFAVKTNRTLEDMFVHKKPPLPMLKRKPTNVLQQAANVHIHL
ncbi:unnamed protein product, partial [Rotaria sordida]